MAFLPLTPALCHEDDNVCDPCAVPGLLFCSSTLGARQCLREVTHVQQGSCEALLFVCPFSLGSVSQHRYRGSAAPNG